MVILKCLNTLYNAARVSDLYNQTLAVVSTCMARFDSNIVWDHCASRLTDTYRGMSGAYSKFAAAGTFLGSSVVREDMR